mgnify:CR=1 FL=1
MNTYNLTNQLIVSSVVGLTSCCTTFLFSLIHPVHSNTNWRDIALYGALGSVLASKYIIKTLK